ADDRGGVGLPQIRFLRPVDCHREAAIVAAQAIFLVVCDEDIVSARRNLGGRRHRPYVNPSAVPFRGVALIQGGPRRASKPRGPRIAPSVSPSGLGATSGAVEPARSR